jgi:hypothetical protein
MMTQRVNRQRRRLAETARRSLRLKMRRGQVGVIWLVLGALALLMLPAHAHARLGVDEVGGMETADGLLSSFITSNPTLAVCYVHKDVKANSPGDCVTQFMMPSAPRCGHAYRCCIACGGQRICRTTKERCAILAREAIQHESVE